VGGPDGCGGGSGGPEFGGGDVGDDTFAVAMKINGLPLSPARVANKELPPPAPTVQLPSVATPTESVVAVSPVMVPPPLRMLNVTTMPQTGPPFAAVTLTAGRIGTALDAGTDCPSPAKMAMAAGAG
jgi:hypothetical protein